MVVESRDRFRIAHNKGLVVVFELRNTAAGGVCGHVCADGPFIDGRRLVLLEKIRGDEWLENEPTSEVYATRFIRSSGGCIESIEKKDCAPIELVFAPRPGGIQRGRPRVWIRIVVEGVIGIIDP